MPHVITASSFVSETILACINEGFAVDLKKRRELQTQILQAEADIITAKAREAANIATRTSRNSILARLEREKEEAEIERFKVETKRTNAEINAIKAEAKKSNAEANAIEKDAETRRIEAEEKQKMRLENMRQAVIRLKKSLAKLKEEGGEFLVNQDDLIASIKQYEALINELSDTD